MGEERCPYCPRSFHEVNALGQHLRAKHKGKKVPDCVRHKRHDDEPSIASLMIEAQIAQACGEPVDDWLLDMMP